MKLIVGLGNPGKKYQNTRHNVGFIFLDKMAADGNWNKSKNGKLLYCWRDIGQEKVELVKPQSFMNNSGQQVAYALSKHPKLNFTDLFVVHDDLDIGLGEYKIQKAIGPKLHYGIASIEENLKTPDFWRVRIGVDNREVGNRIPGEAYVLQNFTNKEISVLAEVLQMAISDLVSRINNDGK